MQQPAKPSQWTHSLAKSLLVVVPTYSLAAYGALSAESSNLTMGGSTIPPIIGALVVILFTLTHGVVPVFFYRFFFQGLESGKGGEAKTNSSLNLATAFVNLHMTVWYGFPILGLAAMTHWYSLIWVALHLILAKKHHRRWMYLEHGSTCMALLLFIITFAGGDLFPIGIAVVFLQSLLLTIVEWKGKDYRIEQVETN